MDPHTPHGSPLTSWPAISMRRSLIRAEGGDVEDLRETLAFLDLDEQDALPSGGERESHGGGHGRLARAALACDDVQAHGGGGGWGHAPQPTSRVRHMTQWEYATVPLIVHATKQILDQWGEDGWELVQVVPGPEGNNLVAYLKRPKAA